VRLTKVGKQLRNAQSKVNALMLLPSRLYSNYPLKSPAMLLLAPVLGVSLCAATGRVRETNAQSGVYGPQHALGPSIETTHGRFAADGCYPVTPQLYPLKSRAMLQHATVLGVSLCAATGGC